WSARRSLSGESVVLASSERISLPGGSDFHPVWNLEYEVDGTNVSSMVQQNVDLSGDSDGDGASDGDEWYAGTDPDSGLSVFSVTGGGVQTLSPERLVLTWPSVGGKTYSIYRAERMDAAFTRIACGLSATPCVNTYTDSVFGVSAFYRIEVE
ncbi:MAG: thrombospondin type 3 repeat-containing protein, partial [Kiritimatiellae bacterium]|nr:thrombospondin type 3 repeat-containing protein [Kiritimatiellia bacterium]